MFIVTLLLNKVMVGVHTEETFKTFKTFNDSTISKLTDKMRHLNANFKRLRSNIQVRKK